MAWVLLALVLCALRYMSACNISFVELLMSLFGVLGGGLWREFMQRLSAALRGTLGSYLRDAFQEGSADAVVYRHVTRA
jgi:ABC-type proline/glycine betaine transport system permease subunit